MSDPTPRLPSIPSDKFYTGHIVERRDLAHDLWIIRVDPGGEFPFRPGQYATLGIATAERLHERAYSIVSAPHEKYLEFFLELVPQGELTPLLYGAQVGDQISIRKAAKGAFLLDRSGGFANHLLVGTVTGVAPYISYARSLLHEGKLPEGNALHLFLVEAASRSWELGYAEEMEKLASEVPWLTYVPTISRPWEDEHWKGETGRADDVFRKYADLWDLKPDNSKVYLCGHPEMIKNVRGIAKRHGWPDQAVKSEAFFVPPREESAAQSAR